MSDSENELEHELLGIWRKWKIIDFHNSRFKQMVTKTKNTRVYKGLLPLASTYCLNSTSNRS